MGPGWKWDRWEDIGIDDDIPGPELVDPYNGPHGLRPGISTSFTTVLQCIFVCSAMDQDFFKRLTANSNKYARARMAEKSTTLFIGWKWTNITWGEMVRFFWHFAVDQHRAKKDGWVHFLFSRKSSGNFGAWLRCITSRIQFMGKRCYDIGLI